MKFSWIFEIDIGPALHLAGFARKIEGNWIWFKGEARAEIMMRGRGDKSNLRNASRGRSLSMFPIGKYSLLSPN